MRTWTVPRGTASSPPSLATFRPGWRWSNDIRPLTGATLCRLFHAGYILAGTLHVEPTDGPTVDLHAGDAFEIDPGHDAWVVGDEACVMLDWGGHVTEYTRPVARGWVGPDERDARHAHVPRFTPDDGVPTAVYDRLADVGSHLGWAGREARRKSFRLLTIEAPDRAAAIGDRFSSSGANNNGTFHDRSVVVDAGPGVRFRFDTESTLDRRHGKTWHARFSHRYAIAPSARGAVLRYVGEVRPENYVPYWLKPGMRRFTRVVSSR